MGESSQFLLLTASDSYYASSLCLCCSDGEEGEKRQKIVNKGIFDRNSFFALVLFRSSNRTISRGGRMTTQPSLGIVLQNGPLLRQFAKDLLQFPRAPGATTHPLSVLLCLLDLLGHLQQSERLPGPEKREQGTVGLGLFGDVTRSEIPRGGEEEGALEAARAWERRNAGSSPSSSPAIGNDDLDSWKAFVAYLAESVSIPAPLVA